MTNRASMVRSSTPRALNAKARSFGRSVGSAAAAGRGPVVLATKEAPSAKRRSLTAPSIARFGTDPVKIALKSMLNGDRKDLRKFVGVAGDDRGLDRRVAIRPCLDDDRHFLCSFDFAAPVIE